MSENKEIDFKIIREAYLQELGKGISIPHLEIKASSIPNAGLGVFAKKDFETEEIIEFCHSVVLDWRMKYQADPKIKQYAYGANCGCNECKIHGQQVIIPSGFGLIYNSANSLEERNCGFTSISSSKLMVFFAVKPITAGEEILTWWGQNYYDKWCKPKEQNEEKTK